MKTRAAVAVKMYFKWFQSQFHQISENIKKIIGIFEVEFYKVLNLYSKTSASIYLRILLCKSLNEDTIFKITEKT